MRICLQLGKFTRILALIFSVVGPRCAADALTYNTEAVISGWSDHSWVLPSGIPGKVDTITATFNPTLNTTDFPSLDGLALPITFEFSGLTLTSYQSPAPKSLGYAVYTPTAPSAFEIHCGKEFWAIGAILSVRSEVDESYSDSIHTIASVALSAPGPQTSSIGLGFYSEIMTMTANSGVIDFDYWEAVSAFYEDIDGKGHLVGGGKILASAIPEPVTYSVFAGCLLLVFASARRRARRLATMPQG